MIFTSISWVASSASSRMLRKRIDRLKISCCIFFMSVSRAFLSPCFMYSNSSSIYSILQQMCQFFQFFVQQFFLLFQCALDLFYWNRRSQQYKRVYHVSIG